MATGSAVANVGLSVAILVFVLPYAARVLDVSLWQFLSHVLFPLAVPGALLALALLALALLGGHELLPVTTLPRLVVVVGAGLAVYALAYALVGAEPRERGVYRSAVAAVLRRGS